MCIIANPVNSVDATKIFVAPNKDQTKQYTVYSNKIDNKVENNVMILPVPYPTSVEFIKVDDNFFKKCDECFSEPYDGARSFCLSDCAKTLKVHDVGSYLASIVNTISEIENLDKIFSIPNDCRKVLQKYPPHYGFIICKLKTDSKEYNPFAYSHSLDTELFIPTKHYHGHTTSKYEHFDHNIYIYNASIKVPLKEWNLEKQNFSYQPLDLGGYIQFHKYVLEGPFENTDFFAKYTQPSTEPSTEGLSQLDAKPVGNCCIM